MVTSCKCWPHDGQTASAQWLVGQEKLAHDDAGVDPASFEHVLLREVSPLEAAPVQGRPRHTLLVQEEAGPVVEAVAQAQDHVEVGLDGRMAQALSYGLAPWLRPLERVVRQVHAADRWR